MKQGEIRELVGELMVTGFDSLAVNDHAKQLVGKHRVKNIILFKRNVESMEQVTELNETLQDCARTAGHELPLIICTDQENGIVRRLAPGLPGLPGNMAVGATGNPDNAYRVGQLTARQLLRMGVNMNLAPVLDVNNNPANPVIGVRSYGEDPNRVAEFGISMIQGLQECGVIACGKHFPGHGDTSIDSHLALPEISHPLSRLEEIELKPFRRAIAGGLDVIMTAHVVFSSIEPRHIPATLSRLVLTRFLREELGFQGVITTDCLEMNAISETIGVGEGAVQALAAGADMIMVSHRLDRQEDAIESIVNAVLDGRIPEERLVDAATRVREMRERRLRLDGDEVPVSGGKKDDLLCEAIALQQDVCAQAATIVSNDHGDLPLSPKDIERVHVLVDTTMPRMSAADNAASHQFLVDAIETAIPGSQIILHRIDTTVPERTAFEEDDLIIAGLSGCGNAAYIAFLQDLVKSDLRLVLIALQSPYDLAAVPGAPTSVAVYEYTPWMVEAGVDALFGRGGQGRLPVSVVLAVE
ncbi:beta-N-acetylhexosaminidase [Alicyclobacillus dauci]|uniref:Beta-N-acetylhexosaminidase n=1 Tax=Alicyclobacillus dauci TaxID=1475485 RepID=A0ABY6Z3D1_9BACL|nr:beta-N-acetylhexosaminidase [Alicyclobacillus dauci]WAH37177.1 beta-N-acetylhexosaminidase [Alicyclobacillus dauci]